MGGFLFALSLGLCAAALGVILIIKEIEEFVPLPRQELRRWRLLLRGLIVLGSSLMLTFGCLSFATAERLRARLDEVTRVPTIQHHDTGGYPRYDAVVAEMKNRSKK